MLAPVTLALVEYSSRASIDAVMYWPWWVIFISAPAWVALKIGDDAVSVPAPVLVLHVIVEVVMLRFENGPFSGWYLRRLHDLSPRRSSTRVCTPLVVIHATSKLCSIRRDRSVSSCHGVSSVRSPAPRLVNPSRFDLPSAAPT